jgi:SlyX protein
MGGTIFPHPHAEPLGGSCHVAIGRLRFQGMNHPQDEPLALLSARMTELEGLFTHLQRTVQELDQVVLAQQRRIEVLEAQVLRLAAGLEALSGSSEPPRTMEDERPPHY